MKSFAYILIVLGIGLTSCFKEEQPVPKKDRGHIVSESVEMGVTYDTKFYISLNNKSISGSIKKYDWDIALSGDSLIPYIRLNTSLGMYAVNTRKKSIYEVTDTSGLMSRVRYDYPRGDKDSLALTGILDSGFVYLIYLGTDEGLQSRGIVLLTANISNNKYRLHYRYLNNSNDQSAFIDFNPDKQHILFRFNSSAILEEPVLDNWDFQLTQYAHIYYNPFQTYSVVGCIINPLRVQGAVYDGQKTFSDISYSDALTANYSRKEDIIGFSWKYYDLNNNKYVVKPEKTYFIKRFDGKIFKLHFIGFYNQKGEKGTPIFEYKEL